MGQYEPDDSRNVTLNTGNNPIEPERTGPRESETRQQAEGSADPTQTNEPQAIKNQAGAARPVYDQYEVNQSGSINAEAKADVEPRTDDKQASGSQSSEPLADEGSAQPGYGNARNAAGQMEQNEIEDTDKTPAGYSQMRQQQQQTTQAPTDRDDPGAASPPQVSHDMPEEKAIPGEISSQPDARALADANPAVMQQGK